MSKRRVYRIKRKTGMDKADAVKIAQTKPWWTPDLVFLPGSSARYYVWREKETVDDE